MKNRPPELITEIDRITKILEYVYFDTVGIDPSLTVINIYVSNEDYVVVCAIRWIDIYKTKESALTARNAIRKKTGFVLGELKECNVGFLNDGYGKARNVLLTIKDAHSTDKRCDKIGSIFKEYVVKSLMEQTK